MAELVSIKRNVDVSPGQAAPAVFHCSQGDVGSKIILGLLNNGTTYAIPSGVTVTIEGSESNGSIFTPISATASGSDITFYLTGEMTAVAGPAICQAVLKSGSNILGTANFTLEVESSPMGADAPPVFTDAGWTWMLNKLNTEFVPALGDNIIDAIDSKADQSDLTALSNTVAGHTGSITVLNNTVNTLNGGVTENRQNIALKLDKNQGTTNAGKYLKVGANGDVETADLDVTTDKTLSIADKAADAKAVGDELDVLKADLNNIDSDLYTYSKNVFPNNATWENATFGSNGQIVNKTTGKDDATEIEYIPVSAGNWTVSWKANDLNCRMYAWGYNANHEPLSVVINNATMNIVTRSVTFTAPENCAFIRIRIHRSGATYTDIIPEELQVEKGTTATAYVPWSKTSNLDVTDERFDKIDERFDEIDYEKRQYYSDVNLLENLIVGYIKDDGTFSPMTSWRRSDYIPVRPGMYVYFYNINPWSFFYYFDSNKVGIGGKNIERPVTLHNNMLVVHQVPDGAAYMIVSLESSKAETCWGNYSPTVPTGKIIYSNKATLRSYSEYPENPCDYSGMDACTFRKGLCIGDSITGGGFNYSSGTNPWHDGNVYSYPSQFQKMTGVQMTNEGHSGLTTVQWWDNYGTGGEHEIDFSGYDFAIIHLGINDVSYSVPIADTTTAYTNIINALKNANEGIKIFVCTIIPAYADATNKTVYTNINNMVKNFANTLDNVYLCDLTEYGHEYTVSQYTAGHLTAYGYWRMAKDLISYIGYIMQSIPEEFRFIQFIGTDMEYTSGQ